MADPQGERRPYPVRFGRKHIDPKKYIENSYRRQNVQSKRGSTIYIGLENLRKMCDMDSYLMTITESGSIRSEDHGFLRGFGDMTIRELDRIFYRDTGGLAIRDFLDMTIDDLATTFWTSNECECDYGHGDRQRPASPIPQVRNKWKKRGGSRRKRKIPDPNGKEEKEERDEPIDPPTTPTSEDKESPDESPSERARRIVVPPEESVQITVGGGGGVGVGVGGVVVGGVVVTGVVVTPPCQNESQPPLPPLSGNKKAKRRKRGGMVVNGGGGAGAGVERISVCVK